jgi:acyl-coenzyme A thioesterase PaaI-like protein
VPRDMSKWLGDGGMPLLKQLGLVITDYAEERASGRWVPTELSCNPRGFVQAGTFAVVLDALMNFAVLASLEPGETTATLEIKVSNLRAARAGDDLAVEGTCGSSRFSDSFHFRNCTERFRPDHGNIERHLHSEAQSLGVRRRRSEERA